MDKLLNNNDYKAWLVELKSTIQQRQIKAALAVNSELIHLYWELGSQIVEKQQNSKWGSGFLEQLSKDLKTEFPEIGGFSLSNLKNCRQFYLFYNQTKSKTTEQFGELEKSQQLVGELQNDIFSIPWGHQLLILRKIKNQVEFSLKDVNKPIGVSEFKYKELPQEIKNALPTPQELENQLKNVK